jgi:transforming growth factor-beta-induced protein
MKLLSKIMFLAILVIASASCDDDDDPQIITPGTSSLFEVIANSPDHTILEQALIDTDLVDVLNSDTFTVFAPTDAAFANVDLTGLSTDEIRNILLNHVVSGNVRSTDLSNGYFKSNAVETYSGNDNNIDLYINIDSGVVVNGVSTVSVADINASNGTIHSVDAVIPLPNVVTLAAADPNFATLAAALTQEDLLGTLSSSAAPAPFTVFAPTNDAFGALLGEDNNINTAEELLALPTLTEILTYHVLSGAVRAGDITDGISPTTVQGSTFTINTAGGVTITDGFGRVVNIVATDVTTANGVIHVLDNVILPEGAVPTTFEIIANSPDHTALEQALIATGLDDVLNQGTFTVFAPTDTAFAGVDVSSLTPEQVTNILLNHVVTGSVRSTDLSNGYVKTNATETYSGNGNNIDMYINIDNGVVLNGGASVTAANLLALNGVVHVVNEVITIPNIVTLAASNPDFSNLAAALTQQDLLGVLSTDADTAPAPFTVFAPSNDSFQAFLDADPNDGFSTIDDVLNLPILTDVLTYHVLSGAVRAGDITDGISPATVQGETITINTPDGVTITDSNGRVVNIIATDFTGSNGVIHVIDNVILPTLP